MLFAVARAGSILNGDRTAETMTFSDDLTTAESRKTPYGDVPVLIGKTLHTFRFKQMDALAWAAETDRHPARPGVLVDEEYGYNIRTLTMAAAESSGVRLDGTEEIPLRVDPFIPGSEEPRVNEWEKVFKAISGFEFQRITDTIWFLNETQPEQALVTALEKVKKARARSSKASA